MKMEDCLALGREELMQKEADLREEHFNLKFQHAIGKLDNTSRLRETGKDIARVMTAIRQKTHKEGQV